MNYYIADLHLGRYGLLPEVVFPLGSRHIYHHFQKMKKFHVLKGRTSETGQAYTEPRLDRPFLPDRHDRIQSF